MSTVVEQKAANYITGKCKSFEIEKNLCPNFEAIKSWHLNKTGNELGPDVRPSDVAPDFKFYWSTFQKPRDTE